jgi:hypothetical protein
VSPAKPKESKSTSARKRAEVARSEKKNEAKEVDFRGLTLQLPAKLPGTILFDIADLEGGREFTGMMELIKSLLGGPDAYRAVRDKIQEDGLGLPEAEEAIAKLLEDILKTVGLGQGE